MPRCTVCQTRLGLVDLVRNLLHRGDKTYPMRGIDDHRHEELVEWLCSRCRQRGERHRREAAGPEAPAAGTPDPGDPTSPPTG